MFGDTRGKIPLLGLAAIMTVSLPSRYPWAAERRSTPSLPAHGLPSPLSGWYSAGTCSVRSSSAGKNLYVCHLVLSRHVRNDFTVLRIVRSDQLPYSGWKAWLVFGCTGFNGGAVTTRWLSSSPLHYLRADVLLHAEKNPANHVIFLSSFIIHFGR